MKAFKQDLKGIATLSNNPLAMNSLGGKLRRIAKSHLDGVVELRKKDGSIFKVKLKKNGQG